MDVLVALEGVDERRVLGDVGHDPQLDLRVIRGQEVRVGADVAGHECPAHLLAEGRADGDVLQVWVARG